MKPPRPVSIQTLNALSDNPKVYETHKSLIDAHNKLVQFVGPGDAIGAKHVATQNLGTQPNYSVQGTFTRGKITVRVGGGAAANGAVQVNFPPGTWDGSPFAQVTQNGGNGASKFNWTESESNLSIAIANPTEGETYVFQYAIRN